MLDAGERQGLIRQEFNTFYVGRDGGIIGDGRQGWMWVECRIACRDIELNIHVSRIYNIKSPGLSIHYSVNNFTHSFYAFDLTKPYFTENPDFQKTQPARN